MNHIKDRFNCVIKGLQILVEYPCVSISAEHDLILAGPFIEDVSRKDFETLLELGWEINGEFDTFYIFV